MNLLYFETYRDIIEQKIRENSGVRGYKSRLARAIRTTSAYLSLVLKQKAELTPDQAASLCSFWELEKKEAQYFVALVNVQRASTPLLRSILQHSIEEIRKQPSAAAAPSPSPHLSPKQRALYFSHWRYAVAHSALQIPTLQNALHLARRLDLTPRVIDETLRSLAEMDLAVLQDGVWTARKEQVPKDLGRADHLFHFHFRLKANEVMVLGDSEAIHHTAVFSLSPTHYREFKRRILDLIESFETNAREAEGEEVTTFMLDFFRFGRS